MDAETFREHFDTETYSYPPTDPAGNEYPLDWFDPEDLDENGYLTDSNGREYSPFQGSLEPISGRCNAPLTAWRDRYPERRYCGRIIPHGVDWDFCSTHRGRASMKSAEDLLTTGLWTNSFDSLYDALDPYKKLLAHGLWSQLMGESTYQFDTTTVEKTFDFSETDSPPPAETDGDDTLTVTVEYPTTRADRGLALWCAALDTVKAITVQREIISEDDGGVMQTTETTQAQLTAPTDDGAPQHFKTIEEVTEHHLNLPYARLVRDRTDLLKYGGVDTKESEETATGDLDNLVLEVEADPEVENSAPNTLDETAESKEIVDHVDDQSAEQFEGTTEYADPE